MAKLQRGYGPTLRLFRANCMNREKYENWAGYGNGRIDVDPAVSGPSVEHGSTLHTRMHSRYLLG
ncbi:hypothetical protein, partial [Stenotrophomonas maltophilia]|uniref:hypothetical protein n=1 Tax=Stenotrophomonas maltophilia TaxID=40324 RepID=UPI001953BC63